MQEERLINKTYKGKPITKRKWGRPKIRWDDYVLNDL